MRQDVVTEDGHLAGAKPPFRLARYNTPPRTGRMRRVLKMLNVSVEQYMAATNQPLNHFARANPGWSQRAWEVIAIENADRWREL